MTDMREDGLARLRNGEALKLSDQLRLVLRLSIPAVLSQLSTIIMEYIDASMVGQLGAEASASIGLVSSTLWLAGGLAVAVSTGFTVQVAHAIGAKRDGYARELVRHGLTASFLCSLLLLVAGLFLSVPLPRLLGGSPEICRDASRYFAVYALGVPAMEMSFTAGGMLECSGDMRTPSILNILACILDVLFNAFFIFPGRTVLFLGRPWEMPGMGLGVTGAAIGTVASEAVCAVFMLYFLLFRSASLRLRREREPSRLREEIRNALRISLPAAFESLVSGSAQVLFTMIVAPLGTASIAAHSFAITVESLCYMPGYGIAMAATTIVGQSIGAKRKDMTKRLSWLCVAVGMLSMGGSALLMYAFAPLMIGMLSPHPGVRTLGTAILRIEAFAEPMFAASIVASGVMRGAGDTLTSGILNLVSMWLVRLPLAAFLSARYGLRGAWTAMCAELCCRGVLFLYFLHKKEY